MISTPAHGNCSNASKSVSYEVTVNPPSGYAYPADYSIYTTGITFNLRDAYSGPSGTVLATNTTGTIGSGSATISGSFDLTALGSGVYTIYAAFTVSDNVAMNSVPLTAQVTFTVGYKVEWADMIDMEAYPASNSTRRFQITPNRTYSESQSLNYLPKNVDGWMELGAVFRPIPGTRNVFILLSQFLRVEPFARGTTDYYVEYLKDDGTPTATTGQGVYIRMGGSRYKFQGISISDRIRIDRRSGVIRFYKENSTAQLDVIDVATGVTTTAYSVAFNTELYALVLGGWAQDGFTNVLTSFDCVYAASVFPSATRTLTGHNYEAPGGMLYFSYFSEYFASNKKLIYRVYDYHHQVKQSSEIITGSVQRILPVEQGENRYELNIDNLITNQTYILEITNEKGEQFYLRFTKK